MEPINKKSVSKAGVIDAFNKNTNFMIASHFEGIESVSVDIQDDVSIVYSDISDETFNYVFENHFSDDSVNVRIKHIAEFYKQKNVPWTWWVSPGDTPENLEQKLREAGFAKTEEYNGMYCDIGKRNMLSNMPKLECKRVHSILQLRDFYNIHASEHFDQVWSKMSPKMFQDSSALEFYVGYVGAKPVTTGLVVFHAGIAGIYSIATDEQERKKGYATAMMQCLLNRIEQQGYAYAALSASNDLKKFYEKFGFQDICTYQGWKQNLLISL